MPKKKFDVGIELNLSNMIGSVGDVGDELLKSVNVDGKIIQRQPYWEVKIERDTGWSESEIEQIKDKIKSQFTEQYGEKLPEHSEFYVVEAKSKTKGY